jgi:hypothetical protein
MKLLGDNMDIIMKNAETLNDANKEIGIEANAKKATYMLLS